MVATTHVGLTAASAAVARHTERPTGIEPASPVWKTGVSAEFTRTAWVVLSPVRGLNPVFRSESPVVYLPQPHGRCDAGILRRGAFAGFGPATSRFPRALPPNSKDVVAWAGNRGRCFRAATRPERAPTPAEEMVPAFEPGRGPHRCFGVPGKIRTPVVDLGGLEPPTPGLPNRCATSCATSPHVVRNPRVSPARVAASPLRITRPPTDLPAAGHDARRGAQPCAASVMCHPLWSSQ